LDDATLKNRAMAMGLISTTTDALSPANKVLAAQAEILAQTGDAQGDFARTSDGLANSQRIMSAKFEEAKAKMGQAFLPIAQSVVGFMSDKMIPVFSEVGGAFQAFFAAFKAGDGDITSSGFPGFMEKVGYYARLFVDQVVEWWPTIREVMVSVFDAVASAAGWFIENVVPRIVAAVEWVVTWIRENWPEIQRVIAEVIDWIGTNVVPVIEVVVGYLVTKFSEIVAWVQTNWPTIAATIEAVIDRIRTVIEVVVGIVTTIWRNWGDNIMAVIVTAFQYVKATIENAINFVKSIIETVMAVIRGDWSGAWEGIKGILGAVWDQIRNIVSTAGALLKEGLSALWTGIKLAASAAWDGLKAVVSAAVDALVEFVKGLPGRMLDWVTDLGKAALSLGEAIVKGIGDGLKGLGDALAKPFKSAWNAIAGWWNDNVGNLSFSIPGWVPGIGGNGFDMPNLPKFHTGGVMPGLSTQEGLAVLRGGEVVFTEDQMKALSAYGFGSSSGPAVHVEHAHFENELDIESFGRMAGWVLAGQGVGI
jgi:phage-related protein